MVIMNYKELKGGSVNTVLGIDASTNSVAYSLMNKDGLVKYGEIDFEGGNVFERLADAQSKISKIKKELKADTVVIESAVYVQNKKTVILLAYAFGAILSAIVHKGSKVEELSPTEWQFAIGNKVLTKAEKEAIHEEHPDRSKSWYSAKYRETRKGRTMKWVKDNYDVDAPTDNVSDAIAISHVGWNKFGG